MARRHDKRLDTRAARRRLPISKREVWRHLTRTRHIGYRRNKSAGTWYARVFSNGRYKVHRVGIADDLVRADGIAILSYDQAIEYALSWFEAASVAEFGYTVRRAVEDYHAYLTSERKPSARNAEGLLKSHVPREVTSESGDKIPLADIEVTKLTPLVIREWRAGFLDSGLTRATANNHLAVLKAALSKAYQDLPQKVPSDHAWRRVKPLRNAINPRVGYYTVEQAAQLMAACEPDFAFLVEGALLTGCRHGELRRLDVSDFHMDAVRPWIHVRTAKNGRGRKVFLDDQGARLFTRLTHQRDPIEPMFISTVVTGALIGVAKREGRPCVPRIEAIKERLQDAPWRSVDLDPEMLWYLTGITGLRREELWTEQWRRWRVSSQIRRMRAAGDSLGFSIKNFHALRHTYASLLIQAGVPLKFVADQLGHSSVRMVEQHYGHLAPSVVAEAIREHMPRYDAVPVAEPQVITHPWPERVSSQAGTATARRP